VSTRVIDMYLASHWTGCDCPARRAKTAAIVVAEEHLVASGLACGVAQVVRKRYPCPWNSWAIQIRTRSRNSEELMEKYGLVAE